MKVSVNVLLDIQALLCFVCDLKENRS